MLLADPTVRVPDLAAEIAAQVARSASLDATEQAPVVAESAELQAAERELRGLTDPAASGGAALLDGVRSALATRLLLGPDIVSATGGNGADGATAAAALSRSLAACGVDGEIGVAVAGDLKALAAGAMRSLQISSITSAWRFLTFVMPVVRRFANGMLDLDQLARVGLSIHWRQTARIGSL